MNEKIYRRRRFNYAGLAATFIGAFAVSLALYFGDDTLTHAEIGKALIQATIAACAFVAPPRKS